MLLERRMRREFDQRGRCWQVVRFAVREIDDAKDTGARDIKGVERAGTGGALIDEASHALLSTVEREQLSKYMFMTMVSVGK